MDNLHLTSYNGRGTPGTCLDKEVWLMHHPSLQENSSLPKSFLTEKDHGRIKSTEVPLEFEHHVNGCSQSRVLVSHQGNASKVLDACAVASLAHLGVNMGKDFNNHSYKEGFVSHLGPNINDDGKQPKLEISGKAKVREVNNAVEARQSFTNVTVPRYLNIEPSLAMDWLEISWDELHIKERIGAGMFAFC